MRIAAKETAKGHTTMFLKKTDYLNVTTTSGFYRGGEKLTIWRRHQTKQQKACVVWRGHTMFQEVVQKTKQHKKHIKWETATKTPPCIEGLLLPWLWSTWYLIERKKGATCHLSWRSGRWVCGYKKNAQMCIFLCQICKNSGNICNIFQWKPSECLIHCIFEFLWA